jgi:hypothetical protein
MPDLPWTGCSRSPSEVRRENGWYRHAGGRTYPERVKILPRRPESADQDVEDAEFADVTESEAIAAGKGRPTPKRRDVVGRRGPVSAPKTRKEALARQKQQTREARAARKAGKTTTGGGSGTVTPAERREAMRRGDPAFLPRRDQGKVRKLARDYVDSRRMFSNYLLLLFPLMIVSYILPGAQIIVLALFVLLLVEWYLTGRRLRGMAAVRGYEQSGSNLSIGFYAGSRAYLPRRWRMPAPQVQRGDKI